VHVGGTAERVLQDTLVQVGGAAGKGVLCETLSRWSVVLQDGWCKTLWCRSVVQEKLQDTLMQVAGDA
jgi:hypothetical protein